MTRTASRPLRFTITVAAALFAALTSVGAAQAQSNLFEAAARVNQTIITGYDVKQRAQLLKFGAGREIPNVEQLALNELIVDALKLQEAERRGIEMEDQGVEEAMKRVASNNGISVDQFLAALKKGGVDQTAFEQKLKADVLWRSTLRRRYGDRMQPSQGEVDAEMELQSANPRKVYDIKQIVVPFRENAPQALVRAAFEKAVQVRSQMKSCDGLPALAKKNGVVAGEIGKVAEAQMNALLRETVLKLKPGGTADPQRIRNAIHVLMLCDIVESADGDRSQVEQRLTQQKAERFSETYIEELRRAALITQ